MLVIADIADRMLSLLPIAWSVGWQEILVIVVVVLILFGGRKIPELAKGIGKGLREFKREMRGVKADLEEAANMEEDDEEYTELPRKKKVKKLNKRPASESSVQVEEEEVDETVDHPS